MADKDRTEHMSVKKLLARLESMDMKDATYASTFQTLMTELEQHMNGEEEYDLPKFEKAISREHSIAMAKSFDRTKKFAHPSAPDKGGPFETVAGLMAAPIDKLKNMFDTFPQDN